jgi:hypothetical protein
MSIFIRWLSVGLQLLLTLYPAHGDDSVIRCLLFVHFATNPWPGIADIVDTPSEDILTFSERKATF